MLTNCDVSSDVLVVGGGGSGLAAAVSAAWSGARVVLLEKERELGGSTVLSVGAFTAAGTRMQRRRGINDDPEALLEDMYKFAPCVAERDVPDLRRILAFEAAATLDWLEGLGVGFTGPFPEPPHRVPRLHNVVPNSCMYREVLKHAAERLGVRVIIGARAERLLTERERVTGVAFAMPDGARSQARAERSVVIATGDFSADREMRRRYLPTAENAVPVNPASTGDGHRMATAVGGSLRAMDMTIGHGLRFPSAPRASFIDRLPMWLWLMRLEARIAKGLPLMFLRPFARSLLVQNIAPSRRLFEEGAILVDLDGGRCAEQKAAEALAERRGAAGYIILDERTAARFDRFPNWLSTVPGVAYAYFADYVRGRPDLIRRARELSSLATTIGADEANLTTALAGSALRPPFIALGPVRSMITITEGGLAVDTRFRALRKNGTVIPGLLAVGGSGQGGLVLVGHGFHLAWALTSGRLAGIEASRK